MLVGWPSCDDVTISGQKTGRVVQILGGPLVYVAGTFSEWTSLNQQFFFYMVVAHIMFLLILIRKVDA
jgi:hypothetical protein